MALGHALAFYRPYLRNDKNFLRARDGAHPPASIRLTTADLVAYGVVHLEQKRGARQVTTPTSVTP